MRRIITVVFLMFLQYLCYAQSGKIDSSFGRHGIVSTDFIGTNEQVRKIAMQTDGKIVAAGIVADKSYNEFALARYQKNGNIDSSFGVFGRVKTDMSIEEDVCDGMQIQPDGKIILFGHSYRYKPFDPAPQENFILVRYKTNGSIDSSFGLYGKVTTVIGIGYAMPSSMALQIDGKIVVAGCSNDGSSSAVALVRYDVNGALDKTFNSTGIVISDFAGDYDNALGVYIQSDGKILISGTSATGTKTSFLLARYLSNGSLDNTFGTSGSITSAIAKMDEGLGVHILRQSDGKYVAFGQYWIDQANFKRQLFVTRYLANGTIDNAFGTSGMAPFRFDAKNERITDIELQADGKIIAIVSLPTHDSYPSDDIGLVRLNTNGTLDTTFGNKGKVISVVDSPGTANYAGTVTLQADNKIIVGGYTASPAALQTNFLLVRYLSGLSLGTVDLSFTNPLMFYPNPIQPTSYLEYTLDRTETVSIRITDLQGSIITTPVVNQVQPAGSYKQLIALPQDLPAGQYILSIRSDKGVVSIKIIK